MIELSDSTIECIPIEVTSRIFDFLSFYGKKKARLVCHRWRFVMDTILRPFAFRITLANRSANFFFSSFQHNVDQVIMKNLTNRVMPKMTFTHNIFPRIDNCVLGWKNTQGKIVNFLKHGCEYSDSISITKYSLEKIRRKALAETLTEINWNNLKELKLFVVLPNYKFGRARKHLRNSIMFLNFAKIPNLRNFEFNVRIKVKQSLDKEIRFQKLCLKFQTFIASHATSLKLLNCTIGTNRERGFEMPKISKAVQQLLSSHMKLEVCRLRFWGVRKLENLVCPALLGSNLQTLKLDTSKNVKLGLFIHPDFNNNENELSNNLEQIFEANSKKLITVYLDLAILNVSWFKNCASLKSLKLQIRNETIQSQNHLILPRTDLVTLEYNCRIEFPDAIRQLIRRNQRSLESLKLGVIHQSLIEGPNRLNFEEFDCLKILGILSSDVHKIALANPNANLPHLIYLFTDMSKMDQETVAWIIKCMPSLVTLKNAGSSTTLQMIIMLLTLDKLKKFTFYRQRIGKDIENYCQKTPGIMLKESKTIDQIGEREYSILVNRDISNTPEN